MQKRDFNSYSFKIKCTMINIFTLYTNGITTQCIQELIYRCTICYACLYIDVMHLYNVSNSMFLYVYKCIFRFSVYLHCNYFFLQLTIRYLLDTFFEIFFFLRTTAILANRTSSYTIAKQKQNTGFGT